jgi:threonine/homoserine/homoserine lactone efflux protein
MRNFMQELPALLGIAAAIAVGAASPGPSFIMVARRAVAAGRVDGLFAALGMGVGGLLFACLALLGLNGLLVAVPQVYLVLKVAGGLYLVYLGVCIWRGAESPLPQTQVQASGVVQSKTRSFVLALTTQMSNPKAAIIYASVFAAFLPAKPSNVFNLSVATLVFFIETGWYALVAIALSAHAPRTLYLRYKAWIDRIAGGVMVALGLRLVTSARS